MEEENWSIRFGAETELQGFFSVTVDSGDSSFLNEVPTDFDYVDVLLGEGVVELDNETKSLARGRGVVVERGSFYRLRATGTGQLVAQVYRLNGRPDDVYRDRY